MKQWNALLREWRIQSQNALRTRTRSFRSPARIPRPAAVSRGSACRLYMYFLWDELALWTCPRRWQVGTKIWIGRYRAACWRQKSRRQQKVDFDASVDEPLVCRLCFFSRYTRFSASRDISKAPKYSDVCLLAMLVCLATPPTSIGYWRLMDEVHISMRWCHRAVYDNRARSTWLRSLIRVGLISATLQRALIGW